MKKENKSKNKNEDMQILTRINNLSSTDDDDDEKKINGLPYGSKELSIFISKMENRLENPLSRNYINGTEIFSPSRKELITKLSNHIDLTNDVGNKLIDDLTPLLDNFEIRNSFDAESEDDDKTESRDFQQLSFKQKVLYNI